MKIILNIIVSIIVISFISTLSFAQAKTFKIATASSKYKPSTITVNAGDVVKLQITGTKVEEITDEGYVHSFTIKELGIEFWVKEGINNFEFVAPDTPGEYKIECTSKCGPKHESMSGKLIVK